jgi:putative FmdB family regulatory protein
MPLYDYQCDHCQTTFEVRASFGEKELGLKPICPNCQNTETRQVLTVGLFVRSGSSSDSASQSSSCCSPNAGPGCCGG